jgi:hypothetical protein
MSRERSVNERVRGVRGPSELVNDVVTRTSQWKKLSEISDHSECFALEFLGGSRASGTKSAQKTQKTCSDFRGAEGSEHPASH